MRTRSLVRGFSPWLVTCTLAIAATERENSLTQRIFRSYDPLDLPNPRSMWRA